MTIKKLLIRVRIEELSPMGSMVLTSMNSDILQFSAYSPLMDATYYTKVKADKVVVDALINPIQLNGELKVITGNIYANQIVVTTAINYLEGYVRLTPGLTVGLKSFGFQKVRQANNSGNIEGVVAGLKIVIKNSGDNIALLTPSGFTAANQTSLVALMNSLDSDNVGQTTKQNEKKRLVETNHDAINSYWKELVSICDIGKRIQKPVSQAKLDEYIIVKIAARLRNDAKRTKVSGIIPLHSKIEFKPLVSGRKRVVYAKPDGSYEITGITPSEYLANLIVDGIVTASKNLDIVSGEAIVENFGMVR